MSISNMKDDSPDTARRLPKNGLVSMAFGMLAILSVVAEYFDLIYSWSGHESPLINFLFLLLPGVAIALALTGIIVSRNAMQWKDSNFPFGVIGLFASVFTFFLCCALFAFFCVASGGLMGLGEM